MIDRCQAGPWPRQNSTTGLKDGEDKGRGVRRHGVLLGCLCEPFRTIIIVFAGRALISSFDMNDHFVLFSSAVISMSAPSTK